MITYTKRGEFERRERKKIERIVSNWRGRVDQREYYGRVYIAGRPERTSYPGAGESVEQAKGHCQNRTFLGIGSYCMLEGRPPLCKWTLLMIFHESLSTLYIIRWL